MNKRVPCNECREHKRRCSGDTPCERCTRLKLECVYTIRKSPKDEEYIKEIEMIEQIDELQYHIATMETEIAQLSQTQRIPTPHASPVTNSSSTITDSGSMLSPITISNGDMLADLSFKDACQPSIIARNDRGYSVAITEQQRVTAGETSGTTDGDQQPLDWTLSVNNGNLSIHTKIHNHSELLRNLQKIVTTLEFQDQVPTFFASVTEPQPMAQMLHILLWKRYGKTRYKGIVKQFSYITRTSSPGTTPSDGVVDISALMRRLIFQYTHCQHYMHLTIHCPTFMRLFVDRGQLDLSPAALALCACICIHPCRHLLQLINLDQSADYATYFEERARNELSERFDETSLEVYLGYTFLAMFKVHVSDGKAAIRYGDFAERLYHVLRPTTKDVGEIALMKRAANVLNRVRPLSNMVLLSQEKKKGAQDIEPSMYSAVYKRVHEQHTQLDIVDGDSIEEQRYIRAFQMMCVLKDEAHRLIHSFQSPDLMSFIGVFGHQLEMVMRLWYTGTLDPDLRLSLPLFDDTIPPDVFDQTLEKDCQMSLVPLLTTMRIYGEIFVLCQSHLPNTTSANHRFPISFSINVPGHEDMDDEEQEAKHQRRIKKLLKLRNMIDFDGTDEEYLQTAAGALTYDTRDLRYSLIDLTLRAAVCALRIQRFLLHRSHSVCLFDPRVPLDAMEVLHRIAKLYMLEDPPFSLRVRDLMEEFITLLKDAAQREPLFTRLDPKIRDLENDMRKDLASLGPWTSPTDVDLSAYVDF